MVNYKIDFDRTNTIFSADGIQKPLVPIGNFKLNDGKAPSNADDFERDQQIVNFLDSVKDGTNKFQLTELGIYPLAGPPYPSFPADLKHIEETILKSVSSQLEHTTWIKVKKGSVLDKPKPYQHCFWESGLGFESFFEKPGDVNTIKTFGSYIDPLEKQNAKTVWPKIGDSIEITPNFMKLVGFGEGSELKAKTRTNKEFDYTMTIGCGTECLPLNACVIKHTDTDLDPTKYFAGNNTKTILLKSSVGSDEKVKTIVVKEWGDKMQVLIYLMYSKHNSGETFMMITCDMVVFMLCINMGVPCIYTGAYNPPNSTFDKTKKYYSILEYNPGSATRESFFKKYNDKLARIINENENFEKCVQSLVDHPDTPIYVQDQPKTFQVEFYQGILADIQEIMAAMPLPKPLIPRDTGAVDPEFLSQIQKDIDDLDKEHLLAPMFKIKKGINPKQIIMLMTRSYLGSKGATMDKPNVLTAIRNRPKVANPEKESKKSFYDIGNTHFKVTTGGEGTPTEGTPMEVASDSSPAASAAAATAAAASSVSAPPSPSAASAAATAAPSAASYIDAFPETDDTPKLYRTNNELKNTDEFEDTQDNADVFNPELSRDLEELDFQKILDGTFKSSMDEYIEREKMVGDVDVFSETVYLLFLYEAYYSKCANPSVSVEDISRIVNEYNLVERTSEIRRSAPSHKIQFKTTKKNYKHKNLKNIEKITKRINKKKRVSDSNIHHLRGTIKNLRGPRKEQAIKLLNRTMRSNSMLGRRSASKTDSPGNRATKRRRVDFGQSSSPI
jgi:hypothetical protein